MRRSADHAMLVLHRTIEAEKKYAKSKNILDLTDVIRAAKTSKKFIRDMKVPTEERRGIPIGQRWG